MTELTITYRGVVYPWQCDHMGHMNVTWYTAKFDEATWTLFAMVGLTGPYLRDNERGMVAVQQNTSYVRELLPGDTVTVRSRVTEVSSKKIIFVHEMFVEDGTGPVAITELTGVHLDRRTRKSCLFPETILERARAMVGRKG